jgi:hypothetical protein
VKEGDINTDRIIVMAPQKDGAYAVRLLHGRAGVAPRLLPFIGSSSDLWYFQRDPQPSSV